MSDADRWNERQVAVGAITPAHLTQLARFWQREHGLTVDGILGPKTIASIEEDRWGEPTTEIRGLFQPWQSPHGPPPRTRVELYERFGNPGAVNVDTKWKRDSIIEVTNLVGYAFPVACHKLVEPALREAMRRSHSVCPEWKPRLIGGFCFRHQRHDPLRPLSKHGHGVAFDLDPSNNRAITFPHGDHTTCPEPFTDAWRELWPNGLPEGVVRAWESCGFAWGADWDEDGLASDHVFVDPMHFEWIERGRRVG